MRAAIIDRGGSQWNHFFSYAKSIDRYQDIAESAIPGRRKDLPPLALDGEAYLWECQSILLNHLYRSSGLGATRFHEF
jgi:hypothetical protein